LTCRGGECTKAATGIDILDEAAAEAAAKVAEAQFESVEGDLKAKIAEIEREPKSRYH